jgi:hypothetical protein
MLFSTLFLTSLGLAAASPFTPRQVAAVASVDRYTGGGCTGTICVRPHLQKYLLTQFLICSQNIAGSGDLHAGCNAITDACQGSLKLNYANLGCRGKMLPFLCPSSIHSFDQFLSLGSKWRQCWCE